LQGRGNGGAQAFLVVRGKIVSATEFRPVGKLGLQFRIVNGKPDNIEDEIKALIA